MGHNRNYSMFSNKNNKQENVNKVENIQPEETTEVIAETANEEIQEKSIPAPVIKNGFVVGCQRLYLRSDSNRESEPICVLEEMTKVIVDLTNSTEEFYKIKLLDNRTGYCMKKYISVD